LHVEIPERNARNIRFHGLIEGDAECAAQRVKQRAVEERAG